MATKAERWAACFLILILSGCKPGSLSTVATTATVEEKKPAVLLREEFRAAVVGKSEDEVIKAVGKPDRTTTAGRVCWIYRDRTRDPITDKIDNHVSVYFANGVVERVAW